MGNVKWRVVCYVNQFFAQIGGEDMANVGFGVKHEAIGPAKLFEELLRDDCEIVGTVYCGDNYFVENGDKAAEEGLALIKNLKPDLLIAGPAFNAGRYGLSCGKIASIVGEKLRIPTVTGMYPENPAVELYRKDTYIVKTGIPASNMRKAAPVMASIGHRLLNKEAIGSAVAEGYIPRDIILNEEQEHNAAHRAIEMVLNKIAGKPFVSELLPPVFDKVDPAAPLKDSNKIKLAVVSDGGLIPVGNPDKIKPNASTTWGCYNWSDLLENEHFVIHSGYDGTWVMDNPYRLLPMDVLQELKEEGKIGSLHPEIYMACGNCASVSAAKIKGEQIAQNLIAQGINAAILTST
jgi:glycine reductase